jgi:SET domain-containing protein
LTIYTCRDIQAGEELTFAYFGADEDDEEEEEEIDKQSPKKSKVVRIYRSSLVAPTQYNFMLPGWGSFNS